MTAPLFTIRVPGSTSNLGPGFDSIGLAVNKYLIVKVYSHYEWTCKSKSELLSGMPEDEQNFLIQIACKTAQQYNAMLPYCRLEVESEIPLARGLGSSASAIVAGIEIANILCDLGLTKQEKLELACSFEGHIDNVGASLYGGMTTGTYGEEYTALVSYPILEVEIVAVIPSYELKTSAARQVLPKQLPYKQAVRSSGMANLLVAAILTNNWKIAGEAMQRDLFHESYRLSLVPELELLRGFSQHEHIFGCSLSGAGPTVICYVAKGAGKDVQQYLQPFFPKCIVEVLEAENKGIQVYYNSVEQEHLESL
ncbi:homoserine kinase [Bacillus sp. 165]|uniref:homoserine kinase n=1 Tax=Bacillus sp. 165 TaxID=1529117 RepID=UPI001ADA4A49|nr:homoserine kinase [Bacillus sp. 165]MBO9130141.1 homoserine kinase [Bacillus sp. 165]